MNKIRVLVANRPRLMRELVVETIADQPDIEIVGETQDDSQIVEMVERTHPDFLIIALQESDRRPEICDSILERFPYVRVLALAPERNSSMFYWAALDIRSNRIEASEDGVLNALRSKPQVAVGGPVQ